MIDHESLKYHGAIVELLGVEPTLSEEASKRVAEREKACGVDFPASIKEWFSINGAQGMFDGTGNHLEVLQELGRTAETRQGYLRVATETQDVVGWYVRHGESNDPRVFHNNSQWHLEDLSRVDWQFESASFTNFIFDMIAGQRFNGWGRGCYLIATAEQPGLEVLAWLRDHFQERPRTEPPGRVFRFFDGHSVVFIASNRPEHFNSSTAEWIIDAESAEALYERAKLIWPYHGLARSFRSESHSPEAANPGWSVIERLGREHPELGPCQKSPAKPSRWRFWRHSR